ncbi:23S rRNA (adenine(2030)-N(6))-methyltransferase RlmJ [Paroceanicella profunda]|uniref:Ribosomal RNA large subunit methyltransferase J n=1 Tax=Paroceanicella profunda TaxID=2579971 RepID=A0A5B8FY01_9RHOB|nr:23S rRNA (adenine(2030)-N(6))-methyltransferase RlmJ [Paroceanicella profunda]QDL91402.1 23S rRNA (adenine(2030)-N(6))-methyltransferase RlmJ [Paroceanicella profunda]
MLSYQHAYHAGGPADLHKHMALAGLLERLCRKPRPISVFETHAGRGLYDLDAPESARTGEAAEGIDLIPPPAPDTPFGRALAATRAAHGPRAYPGSPLIARSLLRAHDPLTLFELHPTEHAALSRAMTGENTVIRKRDGFAGLLSIAPPKPRQGLVLVDPSYEVKDEYAATARFVRALLGQWSEAVVMVWYPLLPARRHEALIEGLSRLPVLRDEVGFTLKDGKGMTGSGLLILNAPSLAGKIFDEVRAQAPILRRL